MKKSLILFSVILQLFCDYTKSYQINNKMCQIYKIQPKNTYNVQKYISNNKISPFILFTVINNCCKCIMLYHNIYNKFHGNTTVHNFYMYDNNECILLYNNNTSNEDYSLNKSRRYKDYSIFFDSCIKELVHYNVYFMHIFNKYKISIIEALFLFQSDK
jgi:hypothetical protein